MTHTEGLVTVGSADEGRQGDCQGDGKGNGGGGRCRDARTVAGQPPAGGTAPIAGTVAVAAVGGAPTDLVDEHFGRAACLQLVDVATMARRVVSNAGSRHGQHGAGISAVELVASHRVDAVIAMKLGPKAVDAFRRARIPVYGAGPMTVDAAVDALVRGELPRLDGD
jgi:predicted Fe-Mo cluster-binding NifX family protein